MNSEDRICPWHDYGEHITLLSHARHGSWSTKNIGGIGMRNIFPNQGNESAIDGLGELYHECADSLEYARLAANE
jgi:hypothetical protein